MSNEEIYLMVGEIRGEVKAMRSDVSEIKKDVKENSVFRQRQIGASTIIVAIFSLAGFLVGAFGVFK